MTLYDYTAIHNPHDSARLISSYGMRPHRHPQILAKQLADTVKRGGTKALEQVFEIHPDRQYFFERTDKAVTEAKESHSNACGCESHSNATGQEIKREVEKINGDKDSSKTEMLIIGGVILGALALILKK